MVEANKIIAGQTTQAYSDIESLVNHVTEGDVHALADKNNIFFHSLSKDLPPLSEIAIPPQSLDFPSNFYIDTATVERKLSQININNARGPDGLPNWFLRDFAPVLCQPICSIYNSSIRDGFVPLIWKSANVIPIPKVHPPRNIESDLRPISLVPTIANVLESIIGSWILELLNLTLTDISLDLSKVNLPHKL